MNIHRWVKRPAMSRSSPCQMAGGCCGSPVFQRGTASGWLKDVELICHVAHPDDHQERHAHAFEMRHSFRQEGEHLLYRCSFRANGRHADFDRATFGKAEPGVLVLRLMEK